MSKLKDELLSSLMDVLQLDAIRVLKVFLEGEVSLLFLLWNQQRPLPPKEIANSLNITKGRVTALLNSLSDKEFIGIEVSSEDRRSFDITLTEKGLDYINEKRKEAESYFDTMIERIGEEKTSNLIGIISDIVISMREDDSNGTC